MPVLPLGIALSLAAAPDPSARAAPPGELCAAVRDATAILEVGFESVGAYPATFRRKRWDPPASAVEPVVRTGRVLRVIKGDPSWAGRQPQLEWMAFANQSTAWWDRFFSGQPFAALAVLDAGGQASEAVVASGVCTTSWCWEGFRAELARCLAEEGLDLPPPTDLAAAGFAVREGGAAVSAEREAGSGEGPPFCGCACAR